MITANSVESDIANSVEVETANSVKAEIANSVEAYIANSVKVESANSVEADIANSVEAETANLVEAETANSLILEVTETFLVPNNRRDKVIPYGMILTRLFKNLKGNMAPGSFDERYKLVPRKMSSLKAKQPNKPPPKSTRNVGKSKHTLLSTSSSTESPPSDNGDLPSTKLSPRFYHRDLKDDPNMSKEQRETIGMFKNLGRALHNFARLLKKGCR
ncbi:hypothetical protein Tco_0978229 [Tanacetum coccineum]|uniref:Uncharacterized protein n=1 Tax=Tanacetum coccineum TaxID=301880 RepID=A0ABQ5EMS5_9ASTR